MTSFEPLAERALRALRDAAPGSFSQLGVAALHELERVRAMSFEERLAALDAILVLAEAFGLPPASRELPPGRDLRL